MRKRKKLIYIALEDNNKMETKPKLVKKEFY